MKRCYLIGLLTCIVPTICMGQSATVSKLIREKQRKMEELEKCMGTTKGLKIAGISTIGVTAVGVAGNIVEAKKIKSLDTDIEKVDKKIDKIQSDIDAKRAEIAEREKRTAEADAAEQKAQLTKQNQDCIKLIETQITNGVHQDAVNREISNIKLTKAPEKQNITFNGNTKTCENGQSYSECLDDSFINAMALDGVKKSLIEQTCDIQNYQSGIITIQTVNNSENAEKKQLSDKEKTECKAKVFREFGVDINKVPERYNSKYTEMLTELQNRTAENEGVISFSHNNVIASCQKNQKWKDCTNANIVLPAIAHVYTEMYAENEECGSQNNVSTENIKIIVYDNFADDCMPGDKNCTRTANKNQKQQQKANKESCTKSDGDWDDNTGCDCKDKKLYNGSCISEANYKCIELSGSWNGFDCDIDNTKLSDEDACYFEGGRFVDGICNCTGPESFDPKTKTCTGSSMRASITGFNAVPKINASDIEIKQVPSLASTEEETTLETECLTKGKIDDEDASYEEYSNAKFCLPYKLQNEAEVMYSIS